jgi:hypothetical protein
LRDRKRVGSSTDETVEIEGPGCEYSCLESARSLLVFVVEEKYRSTASDFHRPIFMISCLEIPACSAEFAASLRKE